MCIRDRPPCPAREPRNRKSPTPYSTRSPTPHRPSPRVRKSTEHMTINKGVWMSPQPGVPVLRSVVLDTTDVRALAEFYRRLLDLQYRPGDEHPGADAPDPRGQDWLVLRRLDGSTAMAFQKVEQLPSATWPNGPHPQMLHLDLTVPNRAELDAAHQLSLIHI